MQTLWKSTDTNKDRILLTIGAVQYKIRKMDNHDKITLRPFVFMLLTLLWHSLSISKTHTPIPHVNAFVHMTPKLFNNCKLQHVKFFPVTLYMARKITIRIVGRKQGGEEWLEDACDMYLKRLKPTGLEISTEWYKNDAALIKVHQESMELSKYIPIVLLDPRGFRCTSEAFTEYVYQWLQDGGSRLVFVIGGGRYPSEALTRAPFSVSWLNGDSCSSVPMFDT